MKKPLLCLAIFLGFSVGCKGQNVDSSTSTKEIPLWGDAPSKRPACVKGIHLTGYYAGTKKGRARVDELLAETELNTVVIGVKEIEGQVFVPGVKTEFSTSAYINAVPDLKDYVKYLKDRGVYTIARVVVFKDSVVPKIKPEWAIRSSSAIPKAAEMGYPPDVWVDYKGLAWLDPYNPYVWKYNLDVAARAVELGFQEVQFDYIRFPSDGPLDLCIYSKPHSQAAAAKALATFLERAHQRLKPMGVELSIDVFGLVGSVKNGMGIGQKLSELLSHVDSISPMMYPSHYAPGELGVKNPNAQPYDMVFASIRDTQKVIGQKSVALRPYLQDFSLGVKYTPEMVRDQIRAANDLGVYEWLLWSPSCRYTKEALLPKNSPETAPQN